MECKSSWKDGLATFIAGMATIWILPNLFLNVAFVQAGLTAEITNLMFIKNILIGIFFILLAIFIKLK
jgi:hypothetical protein